MTQKLTLPIQVGKKYVSRIGKVIEIARINANIANSIDSSNAIWAQTGTVWLDGSVRRNEDLVEDYIEPVTAHPHAEAMLEYAKDAAVMTKPWKNWEVQYRESDAVGWHDCIDHPAWTTGYNYRRKQPKVIINGIECVAGIKEPMSGGLYFVASITRSEYYWPLHYSDTYKIYVDRGLVHRTKEDAIAMAEAMLNFQ